MAAGRFLAAGVLAVLGVLLLALALHQAHQLLRGEPRGLVEVRVPRDAVVAVEWRRATYPGRSLANALGLGEYVLKEDLLLTAENGTTYLLAAGNTVETTAALIKPLPLLASTTLLVWLTALTLLPPVRHRLAHRLPQLALASSLMLLASLAATPLIPTWPDLAPGDKALLLAEKTQPHNRAILVLQGSLVTQGRTLAEAIVDAATALLTAGLALLLIGAATAITRPLRGRA